ncbi:MAG: hypothetical protein MjAS7_1988 [Metallosphaera javensis (ex Sakai et al. 2022)]|nr:MAG: hypothetical protein MjAS7_1988 [Metallosphaera javensis (ex Sakai et al. 2022)]
MSFKPSKDLYKLCLVLGERVPCCLVSNPQRISTNCHKGQPVWCSVCVSNPQRISTNPCDGPDKFWFTFWFQTLKGSLQTRLYSYA